MKLPEFLTLWPFDEIVLTGHRIGLMHVVDFYNDGYTPAMLHEQFPDLSPELIDKVLAFYAANREEVDQYCARCHEEMDRNYANYKPGPAIVKMRQLMDRLRQAEAEHADDPTWSGLSIGEKLRRLGLIESPEST
jgi:uncharacterized protein (DUF433 family)